MSSDIVIPSTTEFKTNMELLPQQKRAKLVGQTLYQNFVGKAGEIMQTRTSSIMYRSDHGWP